MKIARLLSAGTLTSGHALGVDSYRAGSAVTWEWRGGVGAQGRAPNQGLGLKGTWRECSGRGVLAGWGGCGGVWSGAVRGACSGGGASEGFLLCLFKGSGGWRHSELGGPGPKCSSGRVTFHGGGGRGEGGGDGEGSGWGPTLGAFVRTLRALGAPSSLPWEAALCALCRTFSSIPDACPSDTGARPPLTTQLWQPATLGSPSDLPWSGRWSGS